MSRIDPTGTNWLKISKEGESKKKYFYKQINGQVIIKKASQQRLFR